MAKLKRVVDPKNIRYRFEVTVINNDVFVAENSSGSGGALAMISPDKKDELLNGIQELLTRLDVWRAQPAM